MQSMEAVCEEAEHTVKKLKTNRPSISLQKKDSSSEVFDNCETQQTSIFTKLHKLHEEYAEKSNGTRLKQNSHLLDKLVARERLNTLILNLYPGNRGYSLAFRTAPQSDNPDNTAEIIQIKEWPYEMDEFLMYINNEELPPFLLELLEQDFSYLFYNGCIIAEVRNYRQAYPNTKCEIHHVLLRPTLRSLLADINNIVDKSSHWGKEERNQLESQLLIANKPNLCLDPDNVVSSKVYQINRCKQMWNTHRFRRTARKFSQDSVYRKRKLDQLTHKPGVELLDFLNSRAKTSTVKQQRPLGEIGPVRVPNLECPTIASPATAVTINEFKMYPRVKETDDCLPQPIEEYTLETDMPAKEENGKPRVYHIKLSILQRPSNSEYLGELYLDRDHKKNERNGVACRFSLGSRNNANRYIHQFTDIFTESGRKSVRIRYTLGPHKERQLQQLQSQNTVPANLVQQQLTQLSQSLQNQTSVANGISLVQHSVGQSTSSSSSSIPILQSQLQGANQIKASPQQLSSQKSEINALAIELMNSVEQFQAQAAKQQQKNMASTSSTNTAIINLLNSSPASTTNSDTSAAVANAISGGATATTVLPQQLQNINQKLMARKVTIPGARVLNHAGNLIAINNNNSRLNLAELNSHTIRQQPQTITLTSVNSGGTFTNYTTVPVKQVLNQRLVNANSASDNKSTLSALLVGTPAADHPDIGTPNTNSLLIEKLAGATGNTSTFQGTTTHFIQSPKGGQQFMVQSPKGQQTVLTPLSSPPPQNTNTINVQSLNFAQLQSISGLQNVQVQLPGFAQPISLSLNVSSTGAASLQGHPTSLIVSMPATTATATANTITQAAGNGQAAMSSLVGSPAVVLASAANTPSLAQLVTSGVKGVIGQQQGIRPAGPQTVTLSPGGQPFQLITPLQRVRPQQSSPMTANAQNVTARTIQRTTPITIKMATTNANTVGQADGGQLQKQVHLQPFQQQMCVTQPVRRRSNATEPQ
ncbi:unnamed protein product [Brassicogethes aeneus]|uniref:Spt20-like SEP domain-containing protein n=1 Tax=Brassicogethes aeneus TaxID=1431903 RepID=A0A9P0BD14_BRAAE|nr:unnamed protein product [Brassicogethes aeneus]